MIVHRRLCYGILKGWNQDPAYVFHGGGQIIAYLPSGADATWLSSDSFKLSTGQKA